MRGHQPVAGAPAVRSPSALQEDCVTPLKELCEKYHVEPQYSVERIVSAPASEVNPWQCRLMVPELKMPGTGEVVLPQLTFQAVGRGRNDAEQHCARQALEQAHQAGLKAP